MRAAAYFDEGFVEAIVGESFRFHEDNAFTEESGLRNQQSDYVGRLTVQPDDHFRLVHRFRIDQSALPLRAQRNLRRGLRSGALFVQGRLRAAWSPTR